jgi:pyruvate,water dikinase
MSTPFVRWFEDLTLSDRPSVGGKGASLGELTRAGIRVPPGFVITTSAFESAFATLEAERVRERIAGLDAADLASVASATAQVREKISNLELPPQVHAAIVESYRKLCGSDPNTPIAVRSSATSEDSADASFAGLQDTYLWVRGEQAMIDAVRSCWASLYSAESVSYRLRLKLPEQHVAMAVVVQRMVNARCSGVMFTRSPTTGDRSVISIEGSWGLGSAVVSGEVTPDKYVIGKVTGEIVKRVVSQKSTQHVPDPQGGVRTQPVAEELQSAPCLTDAQIVELARIAKQVERHYGAPQDIEWAIEEDIFLLQSRPETVWASREKAPVAAPKAKPFDHVLSLLSGRRL